MSHEGSINTATVSLTALHTRYAVTEGAHFGRGAHITRLSPTRSTDGESRTMEITEQLIF